MMYRLKRFSYNILILNLIAFLAVACEKQAPSNNPNWRLTFSEEFSDSVVNFDVWDYRFDWGQQFDGDNQDLQIDSAFKIEDGILHIRAERDTVIGNTFDKNWNVAQKQFYITSGMLQASKSFSQQYGYFETRARIPIGVGFNSAFWLMPHSGWPPEIDVFELLGREPTVLRMTNHFKDKNGEHSQFGGSLDITDFSENFHVFAIEWNPSEIIWYLDGDRVLRSEVGIPNEPMYPILTLGVGSGFSGFATPTTPMPADFEVDYVRVYELVE